MTDLIVGLDSWVIQDGNYGEFKRGMTSSFALEFSPMVPIRICGRFDKKALLLVHLVENAYEVVGQVMHVGSDWWALDVGLILYRDESPPADIGVGTWLHGPVSIGIDPFPYFERHGHVSGAPALIYDWKIDKIERQTSPWIETQPGQMQRDLDKLGLEEVIETKAWGNDEEYLLHCTRLDGPRWPKSRDRP
ncbi:hypothetical protein JQ596_27725 [Bradyrhizobium manausense]|uniref:hypothetical protein n=1 Tax=Bradyrhizobium TaxID=374 RepID=UPI001BA6A481|nr:MULTISPECIES: hypothetical protein [Bradyrhizobium]MBR0829334.1 hypothetical protein [Bradyrhizobium manausense]UVO29745.1 hypothetical protein KUF59_02960 [Bradyrhizobium arachidis]